MNQRRSQAPAGARGGRLAPWTARPGTGGRAHSRDAVEPLVAAHRRFFPKADITLLRRAYAVAERCHDGQLRKSGAPYITHPLAVALLLAGIGMDTTTLVAALLHDTVEDTPLTLGEVHAEFGEEVAVLVGGVTKLDGARWGERAEAETFRKMILAAADDLRVLVIKLADRVHNLRTLGFHPRREKRERIARASLELLVPFAERLGIYVFKREMEDLAFATLQPRAYEAATVALRATADERATGLAPLLARLRAALAEANVPARVTTRERHLYSIHKERGAGRLRVGDATRITILVERDEPDCYIALGALHGLWRPVPGRMKDFIALPKYNMYRSLHTTVISPEGEPLEVMIRTRAMHRVAEYGIVAQITEAARSSGTQARAVARRSDLPWLRNLLAWQAHAPSTDFLDSLRGDLRGGGIVVFTPAGQVIPLSRGATAIDFAYALDPEIGGAAIGALVNGRLTQLSTPLDDGNVVEILTAREVGSGPSPAWLDFARTGRARVHIQQRLAEQRAEQAALAGRRLLADSLAERDVSLLELESDGTVLGVCRALGYRELDALYAAIAAGAVPLEDLAVRLLGRPS